MMKAVRKTTRKSRGGFTLIEVLIVIEIVSILAAWSIPNMLVSRKTANETVAVAELQVIIAGEVTYRERSPDYASLSQLQTAGLIDASVANAASDGSSTPSATPRAGYTYSMTAVSTTQFWTYAQPTLTGGNWWFYTDETGIVWAASASLATAPLADSSGARPGSEWQEITD